MPQAVRVVPASSPRAPELTDAKAQQSLYRIVPSRALPVINTDRTVKAVLFSANGLRRCNALLHTFGRTLNASTGFLVLAMSCVVYVPAPVGRCVALLAAPLAQPAVVATILVMRYDMAVLLLGTYDFWYRALANVASSVLFAATTRDARIFTAVGLVPMVLVSLLADANYRSMKSFVGLSVFAAALNLCTGVFLMVRDVDDSRRLELFQVYDRAVTAETVMANGCFLVTIMSLHNAYVRRQFVPVNAEDESRISTTVQCILYKSRLRWVAQGASVSRQTLQKRRAKNVFQARLLQLRCHGLQQVIDVRTTLVAARPMRKDSSTSWQTLVRCQLVVAAVVGFFSMQATFFVVTIGQGKSLVFALGVTSFATTLPVIAYFVGFVYQLDILRLLHTSFDFLFVFFHLLVCHLCLCDLCGWDGRAYASASSLLWIYWALLVDAIPPIRREKLWLNVKWTGILIQASMIVAFALFAYDLTGWKSQAFVDNEVFRGAKRLNAKLASWSVGSIFLNRVVTLVPWLGRSLWRLVTYDHDELFMLRGIIEYDDYEMHRRQNRSVESMSKLQQIISALSQQSDGDGRHGETGCQTRAGYEEDTARRIP